MLVSTTRSFSAPVHFFRFFSLMVFLHALNLMGSEETVTYLSPCAIWDETLQQIVFFCLN
jgi:hypothetical protein